MFDAERRLLYVGITGQLGARVDQHLQGRAWFPEVVTIAVEHYPTRTAAMLAERRAIVAEGPIHNLAHSGRDGDPFAGHARDVIHMRQVEGLVPWCARRMPTFSFVVDNPGCTRGDISSGTKQSEGTVANHLRDLSNSGVVIRDDRGSFRAVRPSVAAA